MNRTDVVATTGGKATVETLRTDAYDKIRRKGAPKDYKSGPGPTGAGRLHVSVQRLLLAAVRLERKHDGDEGYAYLLRETLQKFLVESRALPNHPMVERHAKP